MSALKDSLQIKRGALRAYMTSLLKVAPLPLRSFQMLSTAASVEGALWSRVKELMSLSIAIVTKCEGCIIHHIEAAQRYGATREEVSETIAIAITMGGGPAAVYGATALSVFDEISAS